MIKIRSPRVGELKIEEDMIDNRIMRKLNESGFIERTYAVRGVKF